MLTRLKVSGFKNLMDVDVRFGPFTCIAGANGVGKSNLFDAIQFLSALADRPLIDAARSVRDEGGRTADIRSLFHRVGDSFVDKMSFEAEMIIPPDGYDDLGQKASASITFLRYKITLEYHQDDRPLSQGLLGILEEELTHINRSDAKGQLLFGPSKEWCESTIKGKRSGAFISTSTTNDVIYLHQDVGNKEDRENRRSRGRPQGRLAASLPRTVLSATNATESPTALLARREMQSWRLLQLEPSSLRRPDEFTAPTMLGSDGSHLAATLYHLAYRDGDASDNAASRVYAQLANRLAELIDDARAVWVDQDDKRELYTLYIRDRDGTPHPARALSDGTLRFLALAVLEIDPQAQGIVCLEEPENGIHPKRIPAMLQLLQDIATDTSYPVGEDNPLRQVIINTHSPSVVQQVPDDSVLVAELKESVEGQARYKSARFSCFPDEIDSQSGKTRRNWRAHAPETPNVAAKGDLLAYLNPVPIQPNETPEQPNIRRVIDRTDIQKMLQLTLPLGDPE